MTGPIPFTSHPRRVVHQPDGTPALVAIRRNRHRRTSVWTRPLDPLRQVAFVARRLAGDRSWLVELFEEVDDDAGMPLLTPPDRVWVVADHDAAVVAAETICDHLRRGEEPVV